MELTGKRQRLGSATGLYDVRFGEDMHVLIGCGLGGGSLINAGVALRPDARVFRDPAWPHQVATDGRWLYVGNFLDSDLSVLRVDGDTVTNTGTLVKLPGKPASMRGRTL